MSGGRQILDVSQRGRRRPAARPLLMAMVLALTIAPRVGAAQEFVPPPGPVLPSADASAPVAAAESSLLDRAAAASPAASEGDEIVFEPFPSGVLWEPPLANQREPRCFVKLLDLHDQGYVDAAVGTVFSLARIGPAHRPDEGFEIDVMAAVFTRFDDTETLTAADYRVGCPLTFAMGGWEMKLGYEHTSTHTGDVVLKNWEADGMN